MRGSSAPFAPGLRRASTGETLHPSQEVLLLHDRGFLPRIHRVSTGRSCRFGEGASHFLMASTFHYPRHPELHWTGDSLSPICPELQFCDGTHHRLPQAGDVSVDRGSQAGLRPTKGLDDPGTGPAVTRLQQGVLSRLRRL